MDDNAEAMLASVTTEEEIRALADEQPEGQFLDFKDEPPPKAIAGDPRRKWKDSIAKAVCAFANASGGVVMIGVSDKPRKLKPFDDPRAVAEEVNRHLTTQIDPYPARVRVDPILSEDKLRGYLRVFVPQSFEAPHMFEREFPRRRGEESPPMSRSEIADMFGRRMRPSFVCEIRGQLTRDSFPRFIFRITLVNNGGASAENPAVEFRYEAEGESTPLPWPLKEVDTANSPWTTTTNAQVKMVRADAGFMLHPGHREELPRFEVDGRHGFTPPWRLLLRVYSAHNQPQDCRLVISEDFVLRLRSTNEPGYLTDSKAMIR